MRNDAIRIAVFAVVPVLSLGCSTEIERDKRDTLNPMESVWASVSADIDRLERAHAPRSEWIKAASDSTRVSSLPQLHSIIVGVHLEETERQHLDHIFRSSQRTTLFGFEQNFHALVFFDARDVSTHVVKW